MKATSVNQLEQMLREGEPPIIGRIEEDRFVMDVRTVDVHEFDIIVQAFRSILQDRGNISPTY